MEADPVYETLRYFMLFRNRMMDKERKTVIPIYCLITEKMKSYHSIYLLIHPFIYLSIYITMALQPFVGHREQHKQRIKAHRDPSLSGIRTHDPSVPANEDGLCFRRCGHCGRKMKAYYEVCLLFCLHLQKCNFPNLSQQNEYFRLFTV
jgi:hypothetical protein